jgi:indole-3-glycerol phosphate synthase
MSDILQKIVSRKREEVAEARQRRPESELRRQLADAPPPRGFVQALRRPGEIRVIAEIKRASPSAGLIRPDFDVAELARAYERGGAACLSVLTDVDFFQGHLDFLQQARAAVALPVLRKDFLIDPYQVLEARVAGADCILLIAECLDDCRLRDLYFLASDLDLDVLVELHEPEHLERVLKLEPELIGVNNRNLRTFATDLEHSLRLKARVSGESLFVSESGIRTHADVERLRQGGVQAILVGESLMRQPNVEIALRTLLTGAPQ